ncbi:rho-related GTP-binding protein RhoU-like [Petromyzon marinus]|uniref:Rho-related GTP-binding protein RhoU-like n=1 Tax=Petromyzon marinus TaxID=7757 RepID=A0AAJ7TLA5_PETMA|nr:rho-related GTP-binding protein RhoU-like [Petromyzon marinus]
MAPEASADYKSNSKSRERAEQGTQQQQQAAQEVTPPPVPPHRSPVSTQSPRLLPTSPTSPLSSSAGSVFSSPVGSPCCQLSSPGSGCPSPCSSPFFTNIIGGGGSSRSTSSSATTTTTTTGSSISFSAPLSPCLGRPEWTDRPLKCVLVGDGAVGKTSLVVSYTTNGYPTQYVPTAFDDYSASVSVDGRPVRLQLCDMAGQDDFDKLRPLCYPNTDVFLLCFSVVNPSSFQNVSEKWAPELRAHCPHAPLVLVGTQCDLRGDVRVLVELSRAREQPVPPATAHVAAQRIGALGYVECSALTQKNLKEVFDTAIAGAVRERREAERRAVKGQQNNQQQQQQHPQQQQQNSSSKHKAMKSLSRAWWKKYVCVV